MLGGFSADGWALRRPPAINAIANRGDGERGGVDHEGRAGPDDRDEGTRDRRTDEAHDLHRALHDGVRRGKLALGHEHRDDRVHRRVEERVDDAEDPGQDVEVPQLGASGEDERGEDADGDAANDVREEHERPRGESVAERTTEEHERGARDRGGHEDRAEHEAGAGQLEREPGERDEMELVAKDADRLPGEQEAEVADAQRSKQRGAGLG